MTISTDIKSHLTIQERIHDKPNFTCTCIMCGDKYKSWDNVDTVCSYSCSLDYEEENLCADGQCLSMFI